MENSAYFNGEFINLYSQENPILEESDECYCLIFNDTDYHLPIIIRGVIVQDKFVDGLNKQYMVKLLEIISSPKIRQLFFYGKSFNLYPYYSGTIHSKKIIRIPKDFDTNAYLFKVDAYFVRNSLPKITTLCSEYIKIIKDDINKMLEDIETQCQ